VILQSAKRICGIAKKDKKQFSLPQAKIKLSSRLQLEQ